MLHIWFFIFCRVLLAVVPFACHYLKSYQEERATTPLQLEQRVTVRLQPNQILVQLSDRLSWPGQQQAPSLQSAPKTQNLTATTPPAHDPPTILAGPSPHPATQAEPAPPLVSTLLPLPPVWRGSLAYSAQAPPTQA